jgi:hypothetical protein
MRRFQLAGMMIVAVIAAPLTAQAPTTTPQQPPKVKASEERVCENIILTGSRLAVHRFCGTRAEWEDRRKQDREAVEKAQLMPCVITHNSPTGKAAC